MRGRTGQKFLHDLGIHGDPVAAKSVRQKRLPRECALEQMRMVIRERFSIYPQRQSFR